MGNLKVDAEEPGGERKMSSLTLIKPARFEWVDVAVSLAEGVLGKFAWEMFQRLRKRLKCRGGSDMDPVLASATLTVGLDVSIEAHAALITPPLPENPSAVERWNLLLGTLKSK